MDKIRYMLLRFMLGRYGGDTLNWTLIILALFLSFVSGFRFIGNTLLAILGYILLLLSLFRALSRNIFKRRNENQLFLSMTSPLRKQFKVVYSNVKDPSRKYFLCPQCQRIMRIPKKRGKVEITCPTCRHRFNARS